MTVKSKEVWTKGWTWIQEVKWAVTLYNSLYSVSFPSLCFYHLKQKPVGFPTTDEEKKIKVTVMGGGRKNNTVHSFILPALSPQHSAGPFPPPSLSSIPFCPTPH